MMKEAEEEEARPWHSPVPCRPTRCTGRDPRPGEPALRTAALGQSHKCMGSRTVTPRRSPGQIQYLDACRHLGLSWHVNPTQPDSPRPHFTTPPPPHPPTDVFFTRSSVWIKAFSALTDSFAEHGDGRMMSSREVMRGEVDDIINGRQQKAPPLSPWFTSVLSRGVAAGGGGHTT